MSGMSEGSINTKWYRLEVYGGINIEPTEGYEEAIYGELMEEGDELVRRLEPYRDKFEQIILKAKENFSSPIVIFDPNLEYGYIDGSIIEDVPEFDPASLPTNIDPKSKKEQLLFYSQMFQKKLAEEPSQEEHFTHHFKKGSQIYVAFSTSLPGNIRSYKITLAVNNRIKRSTLNWIRDQINPYIIKALE